MVRLTHTEVYLLSQLRSLKKEEDIEHVAQILWGACAYYFWDKTGYVKKNQELLKAYFLMALGRGENILGPILKKMSHLEFLKSKEAPIFENFLALKVRVSDDFSPSVNLSPLKVSTKKKDDFKYEIRFFWPESVKPEIYDLFGNVYPSPMKKPY